jgi:hypothetical protein
MPEEEQIRVAEIMRDRANEEHAAELQRVERVTGVKLTSAELITIGSRDPHAGRLSEGDTASRQVFLNR